MRRPALVLAATALAVGILGHVPTAYAVDGSVSGVVTGPGGPIEGAVVDLYRYDSVTESWALVDHTVTSSDGGYSMTGAAGDYRVGFLDPSGEHLQEFFEDAASVYRSDTISVPSGGGVTVSAELSASAHIAGAVTGLADEALEGVTVVAWRPVLIRGYTFYEVAGTAVTDADGSYDLDGLSAGTYRVQFGDDEAGLATEFYADQSTVWTGQDLVLADAQVLPDIDARLSPDAVVSGRVTELAGEPLHGVEVTALVRVAGPQNTCPICGTRLWMEAAGTETLPDGTYVLDGLSSDTYRIRFERVAIGPLVTEYWEDKGLISNATNVALDVDAAVTGIDAQLVDGEHDAEVQPTVQNTSLPTITGSPVVGAPLTASPGTWSPTPTEYRYQWISGDQYVAASGPTYVPTAEDVGKRISVEVTAIVPPGDLDYGHATSGATAAVAAAPVQPAPAPVPPAGDVPTALATILAGLDVSGKPKVGRTVKVTDLDLVLRTTVSYRFQWFAGTKKIKKATRSKLTITRAMKGKKISVKVTATAASTSKSVRLKVGRVR